MKKSTILIFTPMLLFFGCEPKDTKESSDSLQTKELTHDQVTRNFRNPENEPGLDYTGSDSLPAYQRENLQFAERMPSILQEKLERDLIYKDKKIIDLDSVERSGTMVYQITFEGDQESYEFNRNGNRINN